MIRKAARILREDGAVVARRRAGRRLRRQFSSKRQLGLSVALEDVLAADWGVRGANDHDDGRALEGPLTIGWLIPPIAKGAGGHSTILRLVKLLEQRGHRCRLIVYDDREIQSAEEVATIVSRHFQQLDADVVEAPEGIEGCDALVATAWQTAYAVFNAKTNARKFYFVQDYEPDFYAAGTEAVLAENTYRFGLYGITAGAWLERKLGEEFAMPCGHFDFGSDPDRYAYENDGERRKVVFYARPKTPRRGFELGVFALTSFVRMHPEYEIHAVGADLSEYELPVEMVSRGVLTPAELNSLYNESAAALVLSMTNMSLLPLELLAAGCIPVVNRAENNTGVSDNPFISFAEPSPQALAMALHEIVCRDDLAAHSRAAAASAQALGWEGAADRVEELLTQPRARIRL